jgi:YHS domain-containing protein
LICLANLAAPRADDAKVAMKGYDPVNYFTAGQPAKGKPEFAHVWDGETYHFVSAAHRDRFAATPERYAPQFPGWCAAALTRGEHVVPDPENWVIIEGKLYLFGKPIGAGLFRDKPELAKKAQENWVKVRDAKK